MKNTFDSQHIINNASIADIFICLDEYDNLFENDKYFGPKLNLNQIDIKANVSIDSMDIDIDIEISCESDSICDLNEIELKNDKIIINQDHICLHKCETNGTSVKKQRESQYSTHRSSNTSKTIKFNDSLVKYRKRQNTPKNKIQSNCKCAIF